MNRKWLYALIGGAAAAATVLVLLVFVFGVFQRSPDAGVGAGLGAAAPGSQTASESSPPLAAVTESASSAPGGPREGIKVHGHWTIEVRNPDGTLADRREFDNALVGNGGYQLTRILGREESVGIWKVYLANSTAGDNPCLDASSNPTPCWVTESFSSLTNPNVFKTLTVSGAFVPLRLQGTAVAQRNGTINRVESAAYGCLPTKAPSSPCNETPASGYASGWLLTQTSLATPVTVLTGQQIAVTVTISFS